MIATGQFSDVGNGIRLHYARCGQAGRPPIVFLHGFPEYWGAWEDVLPYFGDTHCAFAPDLRGYNLSSAPVEVAAYRARELVGDLERFVAGLGADRVTVVGHDWGGAIAWQWAIAKPGRIARLVILNSPHPIPFARELCSNAEQQRASAYMNWLRAPGAEGALAQDDFARLDGFFLGMQRADAPWYDAARRARYHAVWSRGLTGALNYYRASPLHPPTPEDPGPLRLRLDPADFRVRVPTLVVWGEADSALPVTLLDGLDELVDDLTVCRMARATHWLAHEEPAEVARLIRAFIAR